MADRFVLPTEDAWRQVQSVVGAGVRHLPSQPRRTRRQYPGGASTDGEPCTECDCWDCQPPTITGCAAAPDGAVDQYFIEWGNWIAHPEFTPDGQGFYITYGAPAGCDSDSSDSSDSSSSGDGCEWFSCLISICPPEDSSDSSSDSSTSSSSADCAVYQFVGTIYTDSDGNPQMSIVPALISGTDILGIIDT